MERILLFDSGCGLCTNIAQDIEKEADGLLQIRSLRDPEVRSMLDQVSPDWKWEPMLLEVGEDNENTQVFKGLQMQIRLTTTLGLRRAWRIARLVSNGQVTTNSGRTSRRKLLKGAGGVLAGLALGSFRVIDRVFAQGPSIEKRTSNYPPKNAQVQELSGTEAEEVIKAALTHRTSYQLQTSLSDFSPQEKEAVAINISWIDNQTNVRYEGVAAAISLKNKMNAEAYLYYSSINNAAQFAIVKPLMKDQSIKAFDVYQITNNTIDITSIDINQVVNIQGVSTSSSGLCTVECMVECLQLYGCSGYAITVCMASIIGCVVAPPACIIAFACSLYCGGAFQNCFENLCCADA